MMWNEAEALEATIAFNAGEEKGFNFFFNYLYKRLLGYALVRSKFSFLAEEMVENAFLHAWQKRGAFQRPNSIKLFLFTCVKNEAFNRHDELVRMKKREQIMSKIVVTEQNGIDYDIVKAEVAADLHEKIDTLPPMCKKIMKMIFLEGKKTKEVQNILNTSESNVKNQKARGLMLLRKKYNVKEEAVYKKQCLWVKKVFLSTAIDSAPIANLYGVNTEHIWRIRNGYSFASITKDL